MPSLRISELDFDNIKANLKDFLKQYRDEDNELIFTDYEFEGSSLSILIDMLAYNTHYNAYLANMVANELFLDSAVKRNSAVSIAKHLGYVPRSTRGARAVVSFTVNNPTGNPASLTLERYTPFETTVDGTGYTFVNLDPVTIEPVNGVYRFSNVEIAEGTPFENIYRVNVPGTAERYEIPNDNVDTTSLRVLVQNSFTDTTTVLYTLNDDITEAFSTSNVYYLEENTMGRYEVFFGDGVLGRKLTQGNLVRLQYLASNGSDTNVASTLLQTFTTSARPGSGTITGIITESNSTGGAAAESIDSVKFNAPKFFASYNRAVTSADYKAIIYKEFPLVESVNIWGGDQAIPPQYGKIFVSMKPFEGFSVSDRVRTEVRRILSDKMMLGTVLEFLEPSYVYITINTNVKYDTSVSQITNGALRNLVENTIRTYFAENLQKFDNDFVFSRLSRLIDETDTSIIGNTTSIRIQRRIRPAIAQLNIFSGLNAIQFNNEIVPGTLQSTLFNYLYGSSIVAVRIDDANGKLRLIDPLNNTVINQDFGTVDYSTGTLTIPVFFFQGYSSDATDIRISANPVNYDIQTRDNQILVIDDSSQNSAINRYTGLHITTQATNV